MELLGVLDSLIVVMKEETVDLEVEVGEALTTWALVEEGDTPEEEVEVVLLEMLAAEGEARITQERVRTMRLA